MAGRAGAERAGFLVEHYLPGATGEELRTLADRVRAAVDELEGEGHRVRLSSSTVVPSDEALLCVLEGSSEHVVREAYARARVSIERISAAVSGDSASLEHPRVERLDHEPGEERS